MQRIHQKFRVSKQTRPPYVAFICVMHRDMRMPQVQDAQARRSLFFIGEIFSLTWWPRNIWLSQTTLFHPSFPNAFVGNDAGLVVFVLVHGFPKPPNGFRAFQRLLAAWQNKQRQKSQLVFRVLATPEPAPGWIRECLIQRQLKALTQKQPSLPAVLTRSKRI